MEIPYSTLVKILGEVFDSGYKGCYELKSQSISDICRKYQVRDVEEFKVWTVAELREMPDGTIFHHINRGRCWIASRHDKKKIAQFQSGGPISLSSDIDPWDQPMRLISKPE